MMMGADGRLYFTSDAGEVTGLFRLSKLSNNAITAPLIPLMLN